MSDIAIEFDVVVAGYGELMILPNLVVENLELGGITLGMKTTHEESKGP